MRLGNIKSKTAFLFAIALAFHYICRTMTNEYHRDIVNILLTCGREGLPARDIARRIYNLHYGLFEFSLDFHRLHRQVRLYLWHQSRRHYSLFQRTGYGTYAIKPNSAIQLDFLDELFASYADDKELSLPLCVAEPEPEADKGQLLLF